jgi:nitrite reductase/ring-hydroxylating ferredoxin subunit
LIGISVMSKAQGIALRRSGGICDHADREWQGASIPGRIGATEDAARRWFAAVATHAPSITDLSQRPGSREISINHLVADWTTVAAAGELPEGEMLEADNRGEPVVVARSGGSLYAFEGWCTHEECPLAEGTLTDQQLECYCHGAVFNIRTGEALVGPAVASLETYPVREQDGEIQVEM